MTMKRILFFTTFLIAVAAHAAFPVPDARLDGQGQVPSGSTLAVKSGATLTVEPGATVNGLATTEQGAKADTAVQGWANLPGVTMVPASTSLPLGIRLTSSTSSNAGFLRAPSSLPSDNGQWTLPNKFGPLASIIDVPAAAAYAKITIQLGESWTDAELKLAIDNYASGTLVIYIHTPDLAGSSVTGQIIPTGTKIYYTCTGALAGGDTRKIRNLPLTDSGGIGNQIDASGRVGSITFYIPVTATIKPTATNLSWTYNLMTYSAHEQDSAGHTLWREPVVTWVTAIPSY